MNIAASYCRLICRYLCRFLGLSPGPQGPFGPPGPAGFVNRGDQISSIACNANEAVFHSASYWLAIFDNSNSEPVATNLNWQLISSKFDENEWRTRSAVV